MRICIPDISGRRGAGLGNELFSWAKAFLASQALGSSLTHPAWGLNARHYHRDFGTSRLDWLHQRMLRLALPTVHFDEQAYRATGCDDYQQAVAVFAEQHGFAQRRHLAFVASGMWGGFHAIRKARVFVLAELLKARCAVGNVHAVLSQGNTGKALVAVHIRRGDFQRAHAGQPAAGFNVALPLDWYLATCASIRQVCGDAVQFLLLTDASPAEVRPFIEAFAPLTTFHLRQTACSDLLLMAFADSIVCSVSSYSMWGAFLSDAPYLWYAPSLQAHEGFGSLWGHEPAQQGADGLTARNLAMLRAVSSNSGNLGNSNNSGRYDNSGAGRGVAIDAAGAVPAWFCERLLERKRERAPERDLIYYGAAPLPAP